MEFYLTLLAFILGFVFSKTAIPQILVVAKKLKLYDPVDSRKLHNSSITSLGGIAIFIGLTLATLIASANINLLNHKYILAATTLMFFTGLKDDLISIKAQKKLFVQFLAAIILVFLGEYRVTSFSGLLGINEVGYFTGSSISIILIVVLINAFNFIDGIDGLASGIAMLVLTLFGVWFFLLGEYSYSVFALATVGATGGFFIYNIASSKDKIFMGDSGSLVIGTIVAVFTILFLKINTVQTNILHITNAPTIALALVIVPFIDTARVITIRIWKRQSPFTPDRNHIHHNLLELIPSHLKVTFIIITTNILLISTSILLSSLQLNINLQFLIILFIAVFLACIPSYLVRSKSTGNRINTATA